MWFKQKSTYIWTKQLNVISDECDSNKKTSHATITS